MDIYSLFIFSLSISISPNRSISLSPLSFIYPTALYASIVKLIIFLKLFRLHLAVPKDNIRARFTNQLP